MRYADADAMRMALEQRLRNEVDATGVALMRLRKRVVFERFLARLAESPAEWVLKGAFALELRLGLRTRMTKDIDLARDEDEATVTRDLATAAALDLGDFFSFRVRRTPALERVVGVQAVRYRVTASWRGASSSSSHSTSVWSKRRRLHPTSSRWTGHSRSPASSSHRSP